MRVLRARGDRFTFGEYVLHPVDCLLQSIADQRYSVIVGVVSEEGSRDYRYSLVQKSGAKGLGLQGYAGKEVKCSIET